MLSLYLYYTAHYFQNYLLVCNTFSAIILFSLLLISVPSHCLISNHTCCMHSYSVPSHCFSKLFIYILNQCHHAILSFSVPSQCIIFNSTTSLVSIFIVITLFSIITVINVCIHNQRPHPVNTFALVPSHFHHIVPTHFSQFLVPSHFFLFQNSQSVPLHCYHICISAFTLLSYSTITLFSFTSANTLYLHLHQYLYTVIT